MSTYCRRSADDMPSPPCYAEGGLLIQSRAAEEVHSRGGDSAASHSFGGVAPARSLQPRAIAPRPRADSGVAGSCCRNGDARRSDPSSDRARPHRICRLRIAQQDRWTEGSTEKRSRSASPGSFEAALRSAGGAIFAVDAARVAYPDYERENGTKWPDRHLDPTEARLFAFAALRALGWSGF